MLLEAEPDICVVGEAENGAAALEGARQSTPDVLLLDITMPEVGGLEVVRRIREVSPTTRVLILTMHDDEGYLREALAAGGSGYVLKRAADVELLSAIRAVYRGGTYLHHAHARALAGSAPDLRQGASAAAAAPRLSRRETEVLQLIALGHTNRQVAERLYLSVKTVETYRARVMAKLGLRNRVELVNYVLQHGLLEESEE